MFFYLLMALCIAAMIWAISKSKQGNVPWARPAAAVFGILAILLACIQMWQSMGSGDGGRILEREEYYAEAFYEILGVHIAKNHGGSTALLIVDPYWKQNIESDQTKPLMSALQKGLGSDVTIATIDSVNPVNSETGAEEMDAPLTPKEFNRLLAENRKCDLVISLVGLPDEIKDLNLWARAKNNRPKLVLANGEVYELGRAILDDFIQAAVVRNPDIKYDDKAPIPESKQAAFDERHIIVTPDSINAVATAHPRLFKEDWSKTVDYK